MGTTGREMHNAVSESLDIRAFRGIKKRYHRRIHCINLWYLIWWTIQDSNPSSASVLTILNYALAPFIYLAKIRSNFKVFQIQIHPPLTFSA